jgi:hypothetical protein
MSMLHAMGLVLLFWAVITPAFIGYGLVLRSWMGDREISADRVVVSFWLGLVAVVSALQMTHWLWPVQPYVTVPLLVIGWVLLGVGSGRRLFVWLLGSCSARPLTAAAIAVMVIWMSNRAIGPSEYQDAGMYHAQAVRWNVEYPIVTGLANLNTCLAFNSSAWLYDAMFEAGPLSGRGNHGPTSLLLVWLAIPGIIGIASLLRRTDTAGPADMFDAVLLAPVIHLMLGPDTASYRTDVPCIGAILIAGGRVYRALLLSNSELPRRSQGVFTEFATVALICSGAVIFKLPAAVLGGMLTVMSFWLWWRGTDEPIAARIRRSGVVVSVCLAIGCVWMARGIVISGYPLFPMPGLRAPVSWSLPEHAVVAMHAWVKQWAWHETIQPERAFMGWEWVGPWLKNFARWDPFKFVYPAMISCGLAGVGLVAVWCKRWQAWPRNYLLFVIPLGVGLAAWFLTAPSSRWSNAMAWLLLSWLAGGLILGIRWGSPRRALMIGGILAVAIIVPPVMARLVVLNRVMERGPRAVLDMLFFPPGSDGGFHPNPPVELTKFVTDFGLELTVPVDDDRVFDAPLPATPHPVKNLRLRKPGDLSGGFELVGGTWDPPPTWPNKGNTWYEKWMQRRAADQGR